MSWGPHPRIASSFLFTKKEEATGANARRNLGIPDKVSFCLLHCA